MKERESICDRADGGRIRALVWMVCCAALLLLGACSDNGKKKGNGPDNPEVECSHHTDCGWTEFCDSGQCVDAPSCKGPKEWTGCANIGDSLQEGEGWRYACLDKQCTRMCVSDADCQGENEICSDFGQCIQYTGDLKPFDSGDATPGALQAGVGQALFDLPVGVEMGGYGNRNATNDGRFAHALSASRGQMDAQYVRAVVLKTEHSRLLMMRMPIVFAFSELRDKLARYLQEKTGEDWHDEIIISATHTHSGPTGFWRMPEDVLLDPGSLGAGHFNQIISDWFVTSMENAVDDALANMAPARFGWAIDNDFDPHNRVADDRFDSTPHFVMHRALFARVDYDDGPHEGEPMAVLFSYPSHGTHNSGDYMTDDALGGAEHGISQALYRQYGRYIPALFFSASSGSMSPQLTENNHPFPYARELGAYIVPQMVMDTINGITTKHDIGMRSRTYRFNLSYDAIGYTDGEFKSPLGRPLGGVFRSGALQCKGPHADDDDYSTYIPKDAVSCIGNVAGIINNYQPTPLTRSQITALQIDGLSAITMPGEPTMGIGWQVLRGLRDQFGLDTANEWLFGYANDHLLYMTPTNLRGDAPDWPGLELWGYDPDQQETSFDAFPDYAFSYLQGGYETEMTPWGWKSGDWLVARAMDAWAWLEDPDAAPSEFPPILPTQYTDLDTTPFPKDATPDDAPGTMGQIGHVYTEADKQAIDDQNDAAGDDGDIIYRSNTYTTIPDTLKRMTPVHFVWIGGDSGAEKPEAPHVLLQCQDGNGDFQNVTGRDGLPIDNRGFAMITRINIIAEGSEHPVYYWSVLWEATKDVPAGTCRLHVDGHYYSGADKTRKPYTVDSKNFHIVPNDEGEADVALDNETLRVNAYYPPMTNLEQNYKGERARLHGSVRLRDPRVRISDLAAMTVEDDALLGGDYIDANSVSFYGTIDDNGTSRNVNDTCADLDASIGSCQIVAGGGGQDPNTGTPIAPTATIELHLASGVTPTELDVTVADQFGNTAQGTYTNAP